jgi:putative DNA primase/helicase
VSPYEFRLDTCALNPSHGATMKLRAESKGGFYAGCFHESCGSNKNCWRRVRDAIGGFDRLPPGAFVRGDHTEIARRYIADENTGLEAPIAWVDYHVWKYSGTTGLWHPTTIDEERTNITRYAGSLVGIQGKSLRLDEKDITGSLKVAHSFIAQPDFFRGAPPGVTFANGHVRVENKVATLLPPSPDHHARFGLPFAYEPGRPVPQLMRFFADIFRDDADRADKIRCMQEFLGACLLGIATRFEVAMILHGDGSNGKSRWLQIVKALFPPSTVTAVPPQAFGQDYARAQLVGSRLNIVSELPEGDILDSGPFKAVASGEQIDGRNPYEKRVTFASVAGLLFAANRLPAVLDGSRGFWRKVLIVSFNRSFENDPARDTMIAHNIIAAELPAIAAWARNPSWPK